MVYLAEIINEIQEAINELINAANDASPDGFIAYIAGGDYYREFENTDLLPYVLEDVSGFRKDLSRQRFYVNYLNKNYKRDGFHYEGRDGIDCLTIELMIYSHLWQSNYYLKHLVRLAHLACSREYDWYLMITSNIRNVINNEITDPLVKKGIKLGHIVKDNYYPVLRDSFAHGLYSIDEYDKVIRLYSDRAVGPVSFDVFQKKFLFSILLSQILFESYRENQKRMAAFLSDNAKIIALPDGQRIKVEAEVRSVEGEEFYIFRPVLK